MQVRVSEASQGTHHGLQGRGVAADTTADAPAHRTRSRRRSAITISICRIIGTEYTAWVSIRDGSSSAIGGSQRTAFVRWLRRLLIVVVLLPLLWLVIVNMLLWTGAVSAIVSGERERSSIKLEHGWAWCIWPTVVHVDDLHLTIDGPRFQLDLTVGSGVADIELHELFSRRFETTSFRGVEVTGSYSVKRPHGAEESSYEGFHRIEGMPPPVLEAEPRPVPEREDAWGFELHGLDAELTALQVNAIKATMQARVRGDLDVLVAYNFALPNLEIEIEQGTIERMGETMGETIAEDLAGSVSAQIAPYNPEEAQGRGALRHLSLDTTLGAKLTGLDVLSSFAKDLPVKLSGGAGVVSCDLTVRDGAVLPGSSASYETSELRAGRSVEDVSFAVKTALHVRAEVGEGDGERTPLRLEANARDIESRVGTSKEAWLSAEKLTASASFARADLVEGVGSLRSASAELPSFNVHDLGAINGVTGGLWIRGGRLAGNAAAKTGKNPKTISFDFAVDIDGLSLQSGENSLRTNGYLRSDGALVRGKKGKRLSLEPLRLKLRDLQIKTERGESSPEWLEVERAEVKYAVDTSRLSVELRGQIPELRSLLAHLRPGEDIFQRLPKAGLGTRTLDFAMSLTKTPGSFELKVSRLNGGPIDAVAALATAGEETRIAVHLRRIGIGIISAGNGSRTIKLAVGSDWFDDKTSWVEGLGR